ncbi:MAG: hypothetical protein HY791_15280 [Deltaproteobacteria bacterium]|nr:hypothetical protein [Deltaproteobacteria bacterium]
MDFRDHLQKIAEGVDGTLFATLMGYDGVAVAEFQADTNGEAQIDVPSLLVEYSAVLAQITRNASPDAGKLEELSMKSERLTTIIRPVSQEYFLALALRPEANAGKGRYLLRINAPKIQQDLH